MEQERIASRKTGAIRTLLTTSCIAAAVGLPVCATAYELMATPNLDLRAVGSIYDVEVEPDGSLIVAGRFDEIGGVPRGNVARILPDGTVDPDWVFDTNNTVYTVARSAANQVYLGGSFTEINGQARAHEVRIVPGNAGPELDAWAPGLLGVVYDIEVAADGDVFMIEGTALRRFPLGGDVAEDDWVVSKSLKTPWDLVVSPDGSRVTTCSSLGEVASLSRTGTLLWRSTWSGECNEIAVAPDGAIFVGRVDYSSSPFSFREVLARLDLDGATDPAWERTVEPFVGAIAFTGNGEVWLSTVELEGTTTRIPFRHHLQRSSIHRFASSGVPLADPDIKANGSIDVMVPLPNGRILMAGGFARVNASDRYAWAQIDPMDRTVHAMSVSPLSSAKVYDVLPLPDGTTMFSGNFVRIDGQRHHYLARLSAEYGLLPDLLDFEQPITQLELDHAGRCIIGSLLPMMPDFGEQTLLRLVDCTAQIDEDWRPQITDAVISLTSGPRDEPALYAGACVPYYLPPYDCWVQRFDSAGVGEVPPAWSLQVWSEPFALQQHGPALYALVGGSRPYDLIKIGDRSNGLEDPAWTPGYDVPLQSHALAIRPEGLYVAGSSGAVPSASDPRLARLSLDSGMTDPAWEGWKDARTITAMIATPHGYLHAYSPDFPVGVIRRLQISQPDRTLGPGDSMLVDTTKGRVESMKLVAGGDVLIAGTFREVGGQPRVGIARLRDEIAVLFVDAFE